MFQSLLKRVRATLGKKYDKQHLKNSIKSEQRLTVGIYFLLIFTSSAISLTKSFIKHIEESFRNDGGEHDGKLKTPYEGRFDGYSWYSSSSWNS